MNPEAYPSCDWCGSCPHCPAHVDCAHPCATCGVDMPFDQPGCMNQDCADSLYALYDDWQHVDYNA